MGVIEKGIILTVGFGLLSLGYDTIKNSNGDINTILTGVLFIGLAVALFAFYQYWTEKQTAEKVIKELRISDY